MAAINDSNTRTANRCRINLAGQTIAEGTSVRASENTSPRGIYTIGGEEAKEHVHTQLAVTFSISNLLWKDSAIEELRIGNGITQLSTFDLEALDDSDNTTIFVIRDCTIGGRDLSIAANNPLESNVQGQAIRIEDGNGGGVGTNATPQNTTTASARSKLNDALTNKRVTRTR
ncbi:hypothetical protein [Deinococcus cellulosilyticus]|uniref:Uncharacterized protein n=1 Tax=Deinococcus cellulosilyticus (strain DSM 18568 / NBRC 106333 / KACC 11606 / 5516J-15) TaxID=1223518 RepID=A0A511N771_DEIC1|nr:hypothetical protein [Deinococcus cellulosilyticus]GEM48693.1 hypothetical protein DC3_43280 [Deinococcus cellulosilyticus NBRC 106333 = KACC 11606]